MIMYSDAVAAIVLLPNNTIKRRIHGLSVNFLQQIIAAAKRRLNYRLQLDDTIDLGNDAQLAVA